MSAAASPAPPAERPVTVARILKNSRETVAFRLTRFQGHDLIDVRIFDEDNFPTKSGFAVQLEHAPALLEAVENLILKAVELGRLPADRVPSRLQKPTKKR